MKERGIALISALVIVAIATAAAMAMTLRAQSEMRRTQVLFSKDRAANALRATLTGLARELNAAQLEALWDGQCQAALMPVQFEELHLALTVKDLRCRFNLNALAASDQERERFSTWLEQLELDGDQITQALTDWMDPEADERPYTQLYPARRAGQRGFFTAAEINQVLGINPATWQRLSPFITAYPSEQAGFSGPHTPFAEQPRMALNVVQVSAQASVDDQRFYRCALLDLTQRQWLFITHSACAN